MDNLYEVVPSSDSAFHLPKFLEAPSMGVAASKYMVELEKSIVGSFPDVEPKTLRLFLHTTSMTITLRQENFK